MIGDNLTTDIAGANNAGIDAIFYNPEQIIHNEQVTFEVISLKDIKAIL
jgi:putative hydrolase of the HAD superfamily